MTEPEPEPTVPLRGARGPLRLWLPALAGLLAIPTCMAGRSDADGLVWSVLAAVAALGGFVVLVRTKEPHRSKALASAVIGWIATGFSLLWGLSHFSIQRGRQLYVSSPLGRRQAVRPARGGQQAPGRNATLEGRAAARWLENADSEWISVAAFSKLSMDLLVVGAPTSLVRACHESALEEVRHAELCFAIAARLDPSAASNARPAPVPALVGAAKERATLVSLAIDSLIQGAYLEDVSSRVALFLARSVADPGIEETLVTIYEDELRHAEHAWDVVRFCLERGGDEVRSALAACAPLRVSTTEAPDSDLEPFGIVSPVVQRTAEIEAARAASARLAAMLSPPS